MCYIAKRRSNQSPDRTAASQGICGRVRVAGRQIVCSRFFVVGGCRSAHRSAIRPCGGVDKIMFTESCEGQADFSGHKFVGPRRHAISEVMPCPNGNDSVPMILWLRRVRGDEFSPNQAVQATAGGRGGIIPLPQASRA